jgi:hypothetical protein
MIAIMNPKMAIMNAKMAIVNAKREIMNAMIAIMLSKKVWLISFMVPGKAEQATRQSPPSGYSRQGSFCKKGLKNAKIG